MNILKKTYKYGFTLVELLVVITIIAILASISFKAASVMAERSAVARTSERLAVISACLAEYYAEFGQYPPVNKVDYTDWDEGKKPPGWGDLVDEKRASGDSGFAETKDDSLMYHFRRVMSDQKWAEFKDLVGVSPSQVGGTAFVSGDVFYTNMYYTLVDGMGSGFVYECEEPYKSYKLYSIGFDQKRDTDDDIHAGQKY